MRSTVSYGGKDRKAVLMRKAYEEGDEAHAVGLSMDACPYPTISEFAVAWRQGWKFGDKYDDKS